MGLKLVCLISITLLSSCSARVITQSALSSVLQDIMSPANTEKAMQVINLAATRANKQTIPDIARPVFASSDCGYPARIIANELPVRAIVARNDPLPGRIIADEMGVPRAIITNDGVVRKISSEPRVFSPDMGYPVQRKVVRQDVREEAPANLIKSLIMPKEIYQPAPIAQAQESEVYPYPPPAPVPYFPVAAPAPIPYLPATAPAPTPYMQYGAPNLYLPAASQLSAMSPSGLPPPTQSRGQFLRKIPIPPPTL